MKKGAGEALRVAHDRLLYREFLARLPARSEIALEANRNYNWLVDEMERAGHRPKLCNPLEAKRRMGLTHKTDKLGITQRLSIAVVTTTPLTVSQFASLFRNLRL